MNKLVVSVICLFSLSSFHSPCSAILGENVTLMKTYFNGPKGKDNKAQPTRSFEKKPMMERVALIRKQMQPQSVSYFANPGGRILRELWLASPASMWTFEEAQKIQAVIMSGRSSTGAMPVGKHGYTFYYADGSFVYYKVSKDKIFSILAVDKEFDPGERSLTVPRFYEYDRIIKPKS